MKNLVLVVTTTLLLNADSDLMTPIEHNSVHISSHKPAIVISKKRNMHKIHKISEIDAKSIARDEVNEDTINVKLTHKGRELFYKVSTLSFELKINAMNGEIIEKSKHD